MAQEQVKPQVILELEKALGIEVRSYNLNVEGEITMLDLSYCEISNLVPLSNFLGLKILNLVDNQIVELSPLSNLVKLEVLNLENNQINELFTLSNLKNLKEINLGWNQIIDISPLSNLINLEVLDLRNNQIIDISPLSNLINLEVLDLNLKGNQIIDLSPLANLLNLEELDLSGTQISDLSPLANLLNLEELDLSGTQISDLSLLANLLNLKKLDLYDNQISDLSTLDNLVNLKELSLSSNQISDLSTLDNLVNLERLYLNSNQVSDLSTLDNLVNLKELSLSSNQISDLSTLDNLVNLERLYLNSNQVSDLSPLANLLNLERLLLSSNPISDLSPLANLLNLEELDLCDTQISDLSPLANLLNLKELDLRGNQISDLSPLANLLNLERLLLDYNQITDISPLSNVEALKELNLNRNQITDLSPLVNLMNLVELNLWHNQISDLSPLADLLNLERLDLTTNQIRDLSPLANSNLIKLERLDLTTNQIRDLFPLSDLPNLEILILLNNQISDISPLSLSNLPKLRELNLEYNNISQLKKNDIINFKSLIHLSLSNNPLPQKMIDAIKSGGKNGLLEYLEAKEKGTVKIEEAKMVLLGEPRAGKTTLQKYLMGLPIDENEISTPDIAISSWKPFEHDKTPEEGRNIKINLWDFGGQEIQYSLHKLFMTTDTLYIIVLDSTKDQNPEKYIAFLENYAPKAPFIIINNYADVLTSSHLKIDANQLRERYDGKDEKRPVLKAIFNRVSVLKAAQIEPSWRKIMDEVEQTIKSELLQLENLNKEFPIEYQNVKQAIEKEYNKPNKHYITMSYFRELCKSLEVTDTEDRRIAILKYLNQIGVLRYFNDSPLMDRHILNPKWLIDGAYSLIINQRTIESQGVLKKEQACKILEHSNKFQFYEEEATFIFKTMNFYGLLHFEESEQKLYIPIRFGSNQPIALSEFYEQGKHFYFDFKADIPEDIMPYLIVKHFSEIKNKHYWSKGAVFTKDDIRVLAKVEDRTIHFYIIGKYHQSYFDTIRSTLKKTLEKLPGLEYEEMVAFEFEGKKIKAKYDDLLVVVKEDWGDYRDYASRTKIDSSEIIKILGGYFSQAEIRQVTNHYYAPVTINDNRYQQTHIFNELERLVKSSQEPNDQKELKELIEELKAFKNEKKVEKKETLGKSVLGKIKKMSSEVAEEGIKDKLKELFPTILQMGIEAVKHIELHQIEKLLS